MNLLTYLTFLTAASSQKMASGNTNQQGISSEPTKYKLQMNSVMSNFTRDYSFLTGPDGECFSNSLAYYVDEKQAREVNAFSTSKDSVRFGVGNQTKTVPCGAEGKNITGYQSTRIYSNFNFNNIFEAEWVYKSGDMGELRYDAANTESKTLFITTFEKMPTNGMCWPSYWFLGPISKQTPWSENGECDVIEGYGSNRKTKMSIHCQKNSMSCPAVKTAGITNDYGQGPWANSVAPVTWALLWDNGFYAWRWCDNPDELSGCIKPPGDVRSGNPNPSTWGTPFFSFPYQSSDKWTIANLPVSLQMIFVVQMCHWTESPEANEECMSNPEKYARIVNKNGSWKLSFNEVYQSENDTGGCSLIGCDVYWDDETKLATEDLNYIKLSDGTYIETRKIIGWSDIADKVSQNECAQRCKAKEGCETFKVTKTDEGVYWCDMYGSQDTWNMPAYCGQSEDYGVPWSAWRPETTSTSFACNNKPLPSRPTSSPTLSFEPSPQPSRQPTLTPLPSTNNNLIWWVLAGVTGGVFLCCAVVRYYKGVGKRGNTDLERGLLPADPAEINNNDAGKRGDTDLERELLPAESGEIDNNDAGKRGDTDLERGLLQNIFGERESQEPHSNDSSNQSPESVGGVPSTPVFAA